MYKAQIKLFSRFIKFVLPYRKKWFLILILSNAAAILGLVTPYLAKLFIDQGIGKKDLPSLVFIMLAGALIFMLNWLSGSVKGFLEQYISKRVHFDLNRYLFRHIQGLSLSWFRDKTTGEHIYKIDNDLGSIAGFITGTLPQTLFIFPALLLTLAIVFYLNWQMALFSLCLAPFLYIPSYIFSKKIRKICEALINNSEDIFKMLEEIFSHIQLIKVFDKQISSTRRYLASLIVNIRIEMANARWEAAAAFINELASKVIIGLITFYGGYQVIKGKMSLGGLTAIMLYLQNLISLQYQFASFFETIMVSSLSCRRISEILDEKPQVMEAKEAKTVIFSKAGIIFKNISFGYRPNQYILKNMSFEIGGASHIALVGPSGCGKTTLLNLLVRLYDPWEGQILIDGYNIKDLKFSALKGQLGFALQEPFLWNDTIENNIKYAKESSTKEEILKIAQLSGVDDFVKDLPLGYQTIVGEDACKISEGQKQKIAIARALIKTPKILILDEAMASMDSASEEKIVYHIKRNFPGLTLITVSHRLSTVMAADLAYYLFGSGEMVIDKPQNLCEHNKEFARLFSGQDRILV